MQENERLFVDGPGEGRIRLGLRGDWTRDDPVPDTAALFASLFPENTRSLEFDSGQLGRWDSLLILFLDRVARHADEHGIDIHPDGLPEGVRGLLKLANAVPERVGAARHEAPKGLATRVGESTLEFLDTVAGVTRFTGELTLVLFRFLTGRARFRRSDLVLFIQETGFEALPIVSLISVLIGVVLAFIGAMQLELFGAEIYVANLVGVGMTREMGVMMAAIIMAGRSGAAYSAQLGTMQVNEEIDAFRTLGVPPMEYLVLPRVLALTLMLPLLVIYADVLGIIGGMAVSVSMFDISLSQYIGQTREAVTLTNIFIGVAKGVLFGLLVAAAGCYHGMRCGRSSAAVGQATTAAVVTAIVSIVVADSLIAVITTVIGI